MKGVLLKWKRLISKVNAIFSQDLAELEMSSILYDTGKCCDLFSVLPAFVRLEALGFSYGAQVWVATVCPRCGQNRFISVVMQKLRIAWTFSVSCGPNHLSELKVLEYCKRGERWWCCLSHQVPWPMGFFKMFELEVFHYPSGYRRFKTLRWQRLLWWQKMKLMLCSGKTICKKYYRLMGWYVFLFLFLSFNLLLIL